MSFNSNGLDKEKHHILELTLDPASGKGFIGTKYIVTPCHGVQTKPTNWPHSQRVQVQANMTAVTLKRKQFVTLEKNEA
jgi:hypothetical protein